MGLRGQAWHLRQNCALPIQPYIQQVTLPSINRAAISGPRNLPHQFRILRYPSRTLPSPSNMIPNHTMLHNINPSAFHYIFGPVELILL